MAELGSRGGVWLVSGGRGGSGPRARAGLLLQRPRTLWPADGLEAGRVPSASLARRRFKVWPPPPDSAPSVCSRWARRSGGRHRLPSVPGHRGRAQRQPGGTSRSTARRLLDQFGSGAACRQGFVSNITNPKITGKHAGKPHCLTAEKKLSVPPSRELWLSSAPDLMTTFGVTARRGRDGTSCHLLSRWDAAICWCRASVSAR